MEYFSLSFLYTLTKDIGGKLFRRWRGRKPDPSDKVALRNKWKPIFEEHIYNNYVKKLRTDIIIRDINRVDSYPSIEDKKAISPWFRVGLVGTYHRGIYVALGWYGLVEDTEGLRHTNNKSGESSDLNALLIGLIRYEDIDSVDWDGDEYYHYPHLYCFFSHKSQPYEELGFYIEQRLDDTSVQPSYSLLDSYENVRKRSLNKGIER